MVSRNGRSRCFHLGTSRCVPGVIRVTRQEGVVFVPRYPAPGVNRVTLWVLARAIPARMCELPYAIAAARSKLAHLNGNVTASLTTHRRHLKNH